MADAELLKILKQGCDVWNTWRMENPTSELDLRGVDLSGWDLCGYDLHKCELINSKLVRTNLVNSDLTRAIIAASHAMDVDLRGAILRDAWLHETCLFRADLRGAELSDALLNGADLREADLRGAIMFHADLGQADLRGAMLIRAYLETADLSGSRLDGVDGRQCILRRAHLHATDLIGADLREADLSCASLVRTNLQDVKLGGCRVYGTSVWDVNLQGTEQSGLLLGEEGGEGLVVDNLELAQFIYLLLNNNKLRDFIDTVTAKAVLILGNFKEERKAALEAIRTELRARGYLPIIFDFDGPSSRNLTETIRVLAGLSRFIVADITDPRSIPNELQAIVPALKVPVRPLLMEGTSGAYGMFRDLRDYPWVLPIHTYTDIPSLVGAVEEVIIRPVECKLAEITEARRRIEEEMSRRL